MMTAHWVESSVKQRWRVRSVRLCIAVRVRAGFAQCPYAHTEQPDAPVERHAFQAFASGPAYRAGVTCRRFKRAVAGDGLEIVVAQLEAYRLAHVTLALKIVGHPHAQVGEDTRESFAVAHRVQVVFERRFAADRFRLAVSDHGPLVASVRGIKHPGAVALAKM